MAIHYVSDIIHVTCATETGRRRSPMTDASYLADLPLKDETTGRTIYRPHKDGTVIWGTDIVSPDASCPYADKDIPVRERWEKMNNDLYQTMKCDSQQHHATFNVALPNSFTREQAINCANNMAMSFAKELGLVTGYGIHRKPGNLHIHFWISEKKWMDGEWRLDSYYVGKNGEKLYGKKDFYDKDGNDLRAPLIDKSTGKQKRGKKGELCWRRINERPFYKKTGWLHEEVDRQINLQLELDHSADRVVRPDREIRDELKKAGLYAEHIGPQSYKEKDDRFWAKKKKEQRLRELEALLTDNKRKRVSAQNVISSAEQSLDDIGNTLEEKLAELKAVDAEMERDERKNILGEYIANELKPQKVFADEAVDRYNMYLSEKRKISQPLIDSLDLGVQATQSEIAVINGNADATERDMARAKFLRKNVVLMMRLRGAVSDISKTDFGKKVRGNAIRKWNRLSVWARCHYIKSRCGDVDALIYQEHHKIIGNILDNERIIPEPIRIPDTEKLENRCRTVADAWASSVQSKDHIPPTDFGILSEILSAEATITETMPEDIHALPDKKTYAMTIETNRKEYEAELAGIARKEAEEEQLRREEERRQQKLAERKRQEEQRRIAEARRAERERKENENRQPVPSNVTAPLRQPQRQNVASAKGKTGGTVAPRYTKADYYELSDRANIFKLFTVIDTARRALADGTKTFSNVLDGIEYYTKHSKHYDHDRNAYGIDNSRYEKVQTVMKQIWVMVKDQEYERPALVNQRPQNYLTVDQCKAEERRLIRLMQDAQAEKARLMPVVVEKSILQYVNQENAKRRKYNSEHFSEKDFIRQPSIGFGEAEKELRKLYAERTDVFISDAIGHRVDIATYTNLVSEADSLQKILDDNYIYHTLEDRQKRQQTKKAPTRTTDMEHTQSR